LMYEVVKADSAWMDRFIWLKNLQTGIVERYFDNSMTFGEDNFEFMQVASVYDCKIRLVGDQVDAIDGATKFIIQNDNFQKIGKTNFLQVKIDSGTYFILGEEITLSGDKDYFYYKFFRKDLIEVDSKIKNDLN